MAEKIHNIPALPRPEGFDWTEIGWRLIVIAAAVMILLLFAAVALSYSQITLVGIMIFLAVRFILYVMDSEDRAWPAPAQPTPAPIHLRKQASHTVRLTEDEIIFEYGANGRSMRLRLDDVRRVGKNVRSVDEAKLIIHARRRNLVIRTNQPHMLMDLYAHLEDEVRKRKLPTTPRARRRAGPKTAPIPPSRLKLQSAPAQKPAEDAGAAKENVKETLKAAHEKAADTEDDEQSRWRSI